MFLIKYYFFIIYRSLDDNNLTGSIPNEFKNLTSLEKL